MRLFLGPPGTGKTTRLLRVVETELSAGIKPHEIAFVAFTRKAAHEAKARAMEKFGLQDDQLPFFRTLHSLAFKALNLEPHHVMIDEDYAAIGHAIGMQFSSPKNLPDNDSPLPTGAHEKMGSNCAYLDQIARLTQIDLKSICVTYALERYWDVKLYCDALTNYKTAHKKFDFTDMMEAFVDGGECPQFKAVIVDEAQDLTPIQWRIVDRITSGAERVYIAGDDDQAIYEWSGADVKHFLALQGDKEVLPLSYRLPRRVYHKALDILDRMHNRFEKPFRPRDEEGSVKWYVDCHQVDFSQGSWLLLVRNRYQLLELCSHMRAEGYPYLLHGKSSVDNENVKALMAWETMRKGEGITLERARLCTRKLREGMFPKEEKGLASLAPEVPVTLDTLGTLGLKNQSDWMEVLNMPDRTREYYRTVRRRGESLIATPRITISTIHQAKGGEADHVLVVPDISEACYRGMVRHPDVEARVFYVAVTRARQSLHLVRPRTNKFFQL